VPLPPQPGEGAAGLDLPIVGATLHYPLHPRLPRHVFSCYDTTIMCTQLRSPGVTELSFARRHLVLAICCMSLFIVGLDNTIVNVALPSIQHSLHASVSGLQRADRPASTGER
jgi:hypothetical protein